MPPAAAARDFLAIYTAANAAGNASAAANWALCIQLGVGIGRDRGCAAAEAAASCVTTVAGGGALKHRLMDDALSQRVQPAPVSPGGAASSAASPPPLHGPSSVE